MNRVIALGLAVAALVVGWRSYGWQGLVLAVSVIVFCGLLEFSRTVRVLRMAGRSPIGTVGSAVMLNARLRNGLPMPKVIQLAGSLGQRVCEAPDGANEIWQWTDGGGASVSITFVGGRCRQWSLVRPTEPGRA